MNTYRDIIKYKKIIPEKRYKYCIKYIDYMCASQIRDGNLDRKLIYSIINNKLNGSVKKSTFLLYLDRHFDISGVLGLTDIQKNSMDTVDRVNLLSSKNIKSENIASELQKYESKKSISELLAIVITYYKRKEILYDNDYIDSVIFDLNNNYDKYYVEYDLAINKVEENNEISGLYSKNYIQSILNELNIRNIKELCALDINILLAIFIFDKTLFLNSLRKNIYSDDNKIQKNVKNKIDQIINSLNEKELEIINLRTGIENKALTLEELGLKYKLTRERIRQIEKKTIKKIVSLANEISLLDDISAIFGLLSTEGQYIYTNSICEWLESSLRCAIVISYINSIDSDFCFNKHYFVITNNQIMDLNSIVDNKYESLPDTLSRDDFDKYDRFTQLIIMNKFVNSKRGYYVKHNISLADMLFGIVDEFFPNGYHIQNEIDYRKLCQKFQSKYNSKKKMFSMRSVQGCLERTDICLIDKGTFLSYNKANHLTEELIDRIIKYISEIDGMIFYSSIFEEFKEDLIKIGISNRYYLKGVLDRKLPKKYKTKRDYLTYKNKFVSSNCAINKAIDKSKGVIFVKDLSNKFPGCKEYIFNNVFKDRDDNIFLGKHRYILLKNIKFSKKLENTIIEEIEKTFVQLKTDIINVSKVYSKMMVLHKDLMGQIPCIDNDTGFYNLIQNKLNDKYYFSRRYISKDINEDLTTLSIVDRYISTLDKFSIDDLKKYYSKMDFRFINSFLYFMISYSNDFVQINQSAMIKKELFNIDNRQIDSIEREVNYYINSFGEINTSNYKGYSSFPKLQYQWNKHLLAGIIRTYLNDSFDIEYTSNNLKSTDYIIRRAS